MMRSALALGLLIASGYAAPATGPAISLPTLKRQDANSYALPELCYFDGTQEGGQRANEASSLSSGPSSSRADYASPHYGAQIPILARFPHFHALGDSYSAGPGAGEYYGGDGGQFGDDWCYRTKGSYAYQLIDNSDHRSLFDLGPPDDFQFLSCTGHVTQNVIDFQIPQLDFGQEDSQMTVTLSIGGNDLGFSKVLIACLLNRFDAFGLACRGAKNQARNLINNEDRKNTFRDSLFRVWNGLKNPRNNYYPVIAHTLYPTFFNAEFANCDPVRILKFGNPLTMQIRREFNELVSLANQAIINHAMEFQNLFTFAQGRIFPIEVDQYYETHRLCEPTVEDLPGFSNDDVWFFGVASSDSDGTEENDTFAKRSLTPTLDEIDPSTCDPDHPDLGHAWGCAMVRHNETVDYDALQDLHKRLPQFITKSFHPKTAGFTATVDAIKEQLPRNVGQTRWSKRDTSTQDTTFDGGISDDHFIPDVSYPINVALSGMVPCTNQIVTFMGTLGESHLVGLDDSPNVVLMYDGVGDILDASDDDSALSAWQGLYQSLREKVGPNAVILAATLLPPPNLPVDVQTRFVNVNDRIVQHVRDLKDGDGHEKVLPVDLSQVVAGPDAGEMGVSVDSIDDRGYISMLGAWANGATHAAINLDWIDKLMAIDPSPTTTVPTSAPTPPPEPSTTGVPCEGNQVQGDCVQASLEPADHGPRAPVCNKAWGNNPTSKLMSRDKARELASAYCQALVDDNIVLNKDQTLYTPFQSDGAIDGGKISAAVLFDVNSCDEGIAEADQKTDFGAMGIDTCFDNLFNILASSCSLDGVGEEVDPEYLFLGGVWGKSCSLWSFTGS